MSKRAEPNPFVGVNYLPINPKMEIPPAYVLQRFFDFDNMLVLLPSYVVPYAYVIARRRQLTAGLSDKALEDTITQADTKVCLAHGLVPVALMYRVGLGWNADAAIESLRRRDTWAVGGGEKAADLLDQQDAEREARIKKAIRDDMWNRSGDAWRSYQARTGQRVAYRGGGARTERRKTTSSTSGSTAGSGVIAVADR